jgi:hypothetical protein
LCILDGSVQDAVTALRHWYQRGEEHMLKTLLGSSVALSLLAFAPVPAVAQADYPNKEVRMSTVSRRAAAPTC